MANTGTPAPPRYAPGSLTDKEIGDKKMLIGILAIVTGTYGVHKFMLGYTMPGVIMLCVSLISCFTLAIVSAVIGIVEGITYLKMTNDEFANTYLYNKKEWF